MWKKVWIIVAALAIATSGIIWFSNHRANQVAKPPIRIGAVLPLTGDSARYGKWIQEGLELAVADVNGKGGINGQQLEIVYEDDQAKPTQAVSAMRKLVDVDKVRVVFGSWASSCVLAQAPIAEQSKTILMAEAISPKIRDAGEYVFRMQPDARYYLKALVPFVFEKFKARTACIIFVKNDFGQDQTSVFKTEFERLGGKVLSEESYMGDATDFRAQLTKIKEQSPDMLFIPGYAEVGTILKQARELGLSCKVVGSVPTENPDLVAVAGAAAEGIIYPSHFDPASGDPLVVAFQKAYTAKYGRPAEGLAALAYDGLLILADALAKCGSDTGSIRDYLLAVRERPGVTGTTSFDEEGDVVKPIQIKTVRDGRFVSYDQR